MTVRQFSSVLLEEEADALLHKSCAALWCPRPVCASLAGSGAGRGAGERGKMPLLHKVPLLPVLLCSPWVVLTQACTSGEAHSFLCWRCALYVNPDLGVPGNPAASSSLSKAVFIKLQICSTQALCRNAPEFRLSIKQETVKWKSGTLSKQSLFCIQQCLWKRSTLLFALQGSRPALVMGQEPVYTRLQLGNNNLRLLEMKGF